MILAGRRNRPGHAGRIFGALGRDRRGSAPVRRALDRRADLGREPRARLFGRHGMDGCADFGGDRRGSLHRRMLRARARHRRAHELDEARGKTLRARRAKDHGHAHEPVDAGEAR